MANEKIYKAGTKIKLSCCTHDFQSTESDIITLESDLQESDLEKLAEEYFYQQKQPEWWFDALNEKKGGTDEKT
jgi:hypothetical protein